MGLAKKAKYSQESIAMSNRLDLTSWLKSQTGNKGKVIAIVNVRHSDGAIGSNGALLYNNDLSWFRRMTTGAQVFLGAKTADSIRRKSPNSPLLCNRKCYVFRGNSVTVSGTEPTKLDVYVAGGQRVYEQALKVCDFVYLTRTYGSAGQADSFFPMAEMSELFEYQAASAVKCDRHGVRYAYEMWRRKP